MSFYLVCLDHVRLSISTSVRVVDFVACGLVCVLDQIPSTIKPITQL